MLHSNNEKKKIAIRGLTPLLQVFDMPASIHFYRDMIGFEVEQNSNELSQTRDNFDWALLTFNGAELMLNTAYEEHNRPTEPDSTRTAVHADTSIYLDCPDVDAAYDYLQAKGLHVEKPVITGYGFKALTLTDPDGYLIVFHWPDK